MVSNPINWARMEKISPFLGKLGMKGKQQILLSLIVMRIKG